MQHCSVLLAVVLSCFPFPGSVLSPLGVASMHSYGSVELEDDKVPPSPEGIGVIGIGRSYSSLENARPLGNSFIIITSSPEAKLPVSFARGLLSFVHHKLITFSASP